MGHGSNDNFRLLVSPNSLHSVFLIYELCVRWQNPYFETGAVEQQTSFQPGHIGRVRVRVRDFLYLTDGLSTL